MTPGCIFTDQNFQFHDGDIGNKILIAIGRKDGIVVVVKTTSNGRLYGIEHGCQHAHRFPNFHLVQNCCLLSKPTWICLTEFYEFKYSDLLIKHFSGAAKMIGQLPEDITADLIVCALNSQDITMNQIEILKSIVDE